MSLSNAYLIGLMDRVEKRNPGEPEFLQAVQEVLESLEPVIARHPEFVERGVIDENFHKRKICASYAS